MIANLWTPLTAIAKTSIGGSDPLNAYQPIGYAMDRLIAQMDQMNWIAHALVMSFNVAYAIMVEAVKTIKS